MPSQSPPAENSNASKLTGYGVAGTVFYLGILVGVFVRVGAAPFVGKQLNEWGDFLAGVFGPLALLWLVLGYFIQAKELRAQVEGTLGLAQHTSRYADIAEYRYNREAEEEERRLRPTFSQFREPFVSVGSDGRNVFSLDIINSGGEARDVKIQGLAKGGFSISPQSSIITGKTASITIHTAGALPIRFELRFNDVTNVDYCDVCEITHDNQFRVISWDGGLEGRIV